MKARTGFVSNSSSSSFVIDRDYVSKKQLDKIVNHIDVSKELETEDDEFGWYNDQEDAWTIETTDTEIRGDTHMDNFDMTHFLRQIGIPDCAIQWTYH